MEKQDIVNRHKGQEVVSRYLEERLAAIEDAKWEKSLAKPSQNLKKRMAAAMVEHDAGKTTGLDEFLDEIND